MAEQTTTRAAKRAADDTGGTGSRAPAAPSMSTPIFDELLREMSAQRDPEQAGDRQAAPVESKHRAR